MHFDVREFFLNISILHSSLTRSLSFKPHSSLYSDTSMTLNHILNLTWHIYLSYWNKNIRKELLYHNNLRNTIKYNKFLKNHVCNFFFLWTVFIHSTKFPKYPFFTLSSSNLLAAILSCIVLHPFPFSDTQLFSVLPACSPQYSSSPLSFHSHIKGGQLDTPLPRMLCSRLISWPTLRPTFTPR